MRKIVFSIILLMSGLTMYAQFDFVTYQLRGSLPQAMEMNPSFINNHKVNVSFIVPFVGVHANANIPFALSSISKKDGNTFTLDLSRYLKNTPMRTALISANIDLPILLVTFDTKIGNFSLGSNIKMNMDLGITNNLLGMLWNGNVGNKKTANINLKNTGVYANIYLDNFIGFSKSILDNKLRVGGRVHFLVSPLGAQSRINNATISTDQNTYDIRIRLNDASLYTRGENLVNNFTLASLMSLNYGAAVDLGVEFKLNDQWSFQAAVNNIGAIRFNKDVTKRTVSNFDTTLSGFDFNALVNGNMNLSFPNVDMTTTEGGAFTMWLPTKIYLGATWQFTKKQRLDGVFSLYNIPAIRASIPAIMVGYNAQLGRVFNWAFNVSYNTYTSVALGTGFTFNAGPVQLYLTVDNFLPAFNLPMVRSIDTRVGLQLNCGYRYKKQKVKDIQSMPQKIESTPQNETDSTELLKLEPSKPAQDSISIQKLPKTKKGKDKVEVIDIEKVINEEKKENP